MKNFRLNLLLAVLISALALNFSEAKDPTYLLTTQNIINTSPNSLEFDIYLQHTNAGESEFKYVLGQYFFNFNPDIANGGNLTFNIIGSNLPDGSKPTNSSADKNILRIAVNAVPSMENLPVISSTPPGTLIAKVRLTTSAKKFADVPLNLSFRTGPENPFTKVTTLGEDGKIKDITVVSKTSSNDGVTGNKISATIPAVYALIQNYPNPFNPETSIRFDIPNASNVKLSIYDITGREISVLVNEKLDPGSYSYKWSGTNFASGIYFYRVQADNFIQTKKMVMIK